MAGAPYVYQPPPTSAAAGTIARLLQQQGIDAANAVRDVGAIRARAAEQVGSDWGNAAQALGGDVARVPAQVGQTIAEENDPKRQLELAQIAGLKRAQDISAKANSIASGMMTATPDGGMT